MIDFYCSESEIEDVDVKGITFGSNTCIID